MSSSEDVKRDLEIVRTPCAVLNDEGLIPSRPCTTFVDAHDRIVAHIDRQDALIAELTEQLDAAPSAALVLEQNRTIAALVEAGNELALHLRAEVGGCKCIDAWRAAVQRTEETR